MQIRPHLKSHDKCKDDGTKHLSEKLCNITGSTSGGHIQMLKEDSTEEEKTVWLFNTSVDKLEFCFGPSVQHTNITVLVPTPPFHPHCDCFLFIVSSPST